LDHNSVNILIVGCGVSGASTALAAAGKDASVTVLEEHPRVGIPSHCSGHVGIRGFKQFAPSLPEKIIENKIKGAILTAPNGRSLILSRSDPVTWVLNRAEFDQHLASLAIKNGANLHMNSRVESVKRSDNGFQVKLDSSKHPHEYFCKVLIDAGGCGARVSRYGGIPSLNRQPLVNSAQCNMDNISDVDSDFVEVYYGQTYAPGFFGWIIPRRDGSAKVGLAAGARTNVNACFERFLRKHPIVSQKLKKAKLLSKPTYHPIPVSGAKSKTYADGILSVGDAASQVKPTTGGGIVFGLICGKIAGETAAAAVRDENFSSSRMKKYEDTWRSMIGFDLSAMASLRQLLYRIPDRYLNKLFDVSNELRIEDVLSKTSDIDFQGRTLLGLARDPRLFLALLSMSVLSIPSLVRKDS
jgi:geranylgeranyl reductase family protein